MYRTRAPAAPVQDASRAPPSDFGSVIDNNGLDFARKIGSERVGRLFGTVVVEQYGLKKKKNTIR